MRKRHPGQLILKRNDCLARCRLRQKAIQHGLCRKQNRRDPFLADPEFTLATTARAVRGWKLLGTDLSGEQSLLLLFLGAISLFYPICPAPGQTNGADGITDIRERNSGRGVFGWREMIYCQPHVLDSLFGSGRASSLSHLQGACVLQLRRSCDFTMATRALGCSAGRALQSITVTMPGGFLAVLR